MEDRIIRNKFVKCTGGTMKRFSSITVSLLVLLLVASCGVEETAEIQMAPFQTSLASARTESQATGRDILIDFYTDW